MCALCWHLQPKFRSQAFTSPMMREAIRFAVLKQIEDLHHQDYRYIVWELETSDNEVSFSSLPIQVQAVPMARSCSP